MSEVCRHCGKKIRRRLKDPDTWEHSKTRAVWCYNSTVAEPAPTVDNPENPK